MRVRGKNQKCVIEECGKHWELRERWKEVLGARGKAAKERCIEPFKEEK